MDLPGGCSWQKADALPHQRAQSTFFAELTEAIQAAWASAEPADEHETQKHSNDGRRRQRHSREELLRASELCQSERGMRAEEGLWSLHDLELLNPDARDALNTYVCHMCNRIVVKGRYVTHVTQTCSKLKKAHKSGAQAGRSRTGAESGTSLNELMYNITYRVPRQLRSARERRVNESPKLPVKIAQAAAEQRPVNGLIPHHNDPTLMWVDGNEYVVQQTAKVSESKGTKRPAQTEAGSRAYQGHAKLQKTAKGQSQQYQHQAQQQQQQQQQEQQYQLQQKQSQQQHVLQAHAEQEQGGVSLSPMQMTNSCQEQQQQLSQLQMETEKELQRQRLGNPIWRFDCRLRREELFIGTFTLA